MVCLVRSFISQELVEKLLKKIEVYVSDSDSKHKKFKELIEQDIEDKLQVPGGATLLFTVGYVYRQEAMKFSGGFLGIGGMIAGAQEVGFPLHMNSMPLRRFLTLTGTSRLAT